MIETDRKSKQQVEWSRQYTLNKEQLKNLIASKFERARQYHEAHRKREALLERR